MISIFNGRKRTLGGGDSEVYAQVGVDFRDFLYLFKGARLGVFLAIALHADENGLAWPSYATLRRETGYTRETVANALSDLCALEIGGHRILTRWQPIGEGGKFQSNRYLIFPSPDELATVSDLPCTENPNTVKPNTVKPNTENPNTNNNHPKPEPAKQEPSKPEPEAAAGSPGPVVLCSIHNVPMKQREKDGQTWYSHKLPGGGWCKGAPTDQPSKPDPHTDWRTYTERAPCGLVIPVGRGCEGRGWECCGDCELKEGDGD